MLVNKFNYMHFVVDFIMNILPPGTSLLPVPQYVFVPMPQVYIVPVLQNIPNPNDYVLIIQQAAPLISVNVPNSNMNVHNCSNMEINTSYPAASIDNSSFINRNSMNHSYTAHDIPNDLISNGGNETPIFCLSDSNSDVVDLDSGSHMSMSSVTDDDNDDHDVCDDNDGGDDDYVTDDNDEESINGAYWF
jgi:hypothetical protein